MPVEFLVQSVSLSIYIFSVCFTSVVDSQDKETKD